MAISDNPKAGHTLATQFGVPEGRITDAWRCRVERIFSRLVPRCVPTAHQIWLRTPEDIEAFAEALLAGDRDFSAIEYVCITEAVVDIYDLVDFFTRLHRQLPEHTRVLYHNFNWMWGPLFKVAGLLGLTRNRLLGAYYRRPDLETFAEMSGWEHSRILPGIFLPLRLPVIGFLLDGVLAKLPLVRALALNELYVVRKIGGTVQERSVSVLIPCRNEADNIEAAIRRTPVFGSTQELLFIDDQSTDGTAAAVARCQDAFPERKIRCVDGPGRGKGRAVKAGAEAAAGDICMILDADLTVIPEDLPQFYVALAARRADFVHGTRLVYPLEKDSMRLANILGNIFFSKLFSFILDQRTTDTLCGTKVFWRHDWPKFEEARDVLGDADLWGDYNLILGAAAYGLKVGQLPVRYFERLEGLTKMNRRLRNAAIMWRVCWRALWRIKFVW
jgi:hypothetical protein